MNNVLAGLLGGNVNADIKVNVVFDPASLVLLFVLIVGAILLTHAGIKVVNVL